MKVLQLLLVAVLTMAGCDYLSDTVSDNYATLADARADNLFERGWLPDILPESSIDIQTINNLDINTSAGKFQFKSSDGPGFFHRLTPGTPAESRFDSWSKTVEKYKERGFVYWQYRDDDTNWVFFCLPEGGECEYLAWLR
jgi:hypothetical protein